MNERQIVKELRLKLREYFPTLQSFIDQDIITKKRLEVLWKHSIQSNKKFYDNA